VPRRQFAFHAIARHLHHSQARQRRAGVKLGAAHADNRARAHLHDAAIDPEIQRRRAARGAGHVVHGEVLFQRLHAVRHAMTSQVGGAGHRHLRHLRDRPPDKRRILQHARPQHAVHAFTNQVHEPVVFAQVQGNVGIALQKVRQAGHHEKAGKRALRIDPQQPLGRRIQERAIGLLQVGQQAHAPPVMGLAVVRKPHLARGALEQARAQPGLHALDQVGHRGARNAQVIGSLCKTAALRNAHEHLHFLESIHALAARHAGPLLKQMKLS